MSHIIDINSTKLNIDNNLVKMFQMRNILSKLEYVKSNLSNTNSDTNFVYNFLLTEFEKYDIVIYTQNKIYDKNNIYPTMTKTEQDFLMEISNNKLSNLYQKGNFLFQYIGVVFAIKIPDILFLTQFILNNSYYDYKLVFNGSGNNNNNGNTNTNNGNNNIFSIILNKINSNISTLNISTLNNLPPKIIINIFDNNNQKMISVFDGINNIENVLNSTTSNSTISNSTISNSTMSIIPPFETVIPVNYGGETYTLDIVFSGSDISITIYDSNDIAIGQIDIPVII